MRLLSVTRTPASLVVLTLVSSIAVAQQQAGSNTAPNAQLALPYGARDANPVSRWTPPASAGRQLTLNDLLTWKQIRTPQLSNDGNWMVYNIGPNEGDAEVVIRSTAAGGKEWKFPVGDAVAANRGAPGGGGGGGGGGGAANALAISGNNRWVAFLVYPSSATPQRGRGRPGAGGAAGNAPAVPVKLGVVNLADGSKREFENVRSFRFAGDKSDWLAIHHGSPTTGSATGGGAGSGGGAGGGGGGGGARSSVGTMLELVNLAAGASAPSTPIANVSEFAFNDGADWIAYAISIQDQVGNSIQLRQLSTGITRSLDAQKAVYRRLTWGDSSDALAAIRVVSDTAASVDEDVTALVWPRASAAGPALTIDASTAGIPRGLVLSADYNIDFGRNTNVLYVGLREPRPPRTRNANFNGTTAQGVAPGGGGNTGRVAAAPQTDADVPSLVLWHWKDPRTQATQQVQENNDRAFSNAAAYQIGASKVVPLTDDKLRNLQRGPRDTWAVASDASEYERDAGIKGFSYRDLYAVNVATGERKLIQKKVPGGGGGGGGFGGGAQVSPFSPDNSKYAYYDTGDWKVYDFATGATKTVTAGVNGKFWDVEDDHNQVKPAIPGGLLGWTRDGASLVVRDNWDLWRLPVAGGAAVNLTVNGQRDQVRYQQRLVVDARDRRGIDVATPMYVETYGEWTKKEGLAQVDVAKGGVKVLATEDAKVDFRRARDAAKWVFTRQTATRFPDWYATDDLLKNERRLTDANPQQKDVAWTPGARLIEYSCDNDTGKRQAVLYLPAGYEQGKKYPMLTYIYEQLSQNYHVYAQPNATRYSNPSVFTSRGYASSSTR
jgi:hypothetical protein